jgi:hypothetical protein
MKIIAIIILTTISICFSCRTNEEKKEVLETSTVKKDTSDFKKDEIKKQERTRRLLDISRNYKATTTFDTVEFQLTYQFQNLLSQNNRVIISDFEITDIEKQNSNFIIYLSKGYYPTIYMELICTEPQIQSIYPDFKNAVELSEYVSDKYLIVKILSFKKIRFKIDSSVNEKEATSYVEIEASDAFICKGELLGIEME